MHNPDVVNADYRNHLRQLFARFYNTINEERVRGYAADLQEENLDAKLVLASLESCKMLDKMPTYGEIVSMSRSKSSTSPDKQYIVCSYCEDGAVMAYDADGYEFAFRCRCVMGESLGHGIPLWDRAKFGKEYTTKVSLNGKPRPSLSRNIL